MHRPHGIMGQGQVRGQGLDVWEKDSTQPGILESSMKSKHSSVGATGTLLKPLLFHEFNGFVYNSFCKTGQGVGKVIDNAFCTVSTVMMNWALHFNLPGWKNHSRIYMKQQTSCCQTGAKLTTSLT